jgi:glycosyltransferase involved in cell wall biosynthesis
MHSWPVSWIPYKKSSWKHDLMAIPYVVINNSIDLLHYWISLGPIHEVGMGMLHPCPAIGTVYDLGVELWDDVPFAVSKRTTRYWKTQKYLIQQCSKIICISKATQKDLHMVTGKEILPTEVVYVPNPQISLEPSKKREPYFITMGGSVHKNLNNVIRAFQPVFEKDSRYHLKVLGDVQGKEEIPGVIPGYVQFEDMSRYTHHLQHASGLIFCSFHEGLGLPPIEAMQYHCPLLLSDIPSLRETCNSYACFVDPRNTQDIAKGIEDIINNQKHWTGRSGDGQKFYESLSRDSGKRVVEIYNSYRR